MSHFEHPPHAESTESSDLEQHPYVRMQRALIEITTRGPRAVAEAASSSVELMRDSMSTMLGNLAERTARGEQAELLLSRESLDALMKLNQICLDTYFAAAEDVQRYAFKLQHEYSDALAEAAKGNPEPLAATLEQLAETLDTIATKNPEAIVRIAGEVGFDFENPEEYTLVAESPRALVYQIHPLAENVDTDPEQKPVLLLSPFILTDGIQALLPHQGLSFAHSYANRGAPTYVVRFKDITTTREVADMTPEEVIADVGDFLETLHERHGTPATVVGTCQGAYMALAGFASGTWAGHANQLIQNVPPNDLTKSPEWQRLVAATPEPMRGIDSITLTLPHGGTAVSGTAAAFAMRLKDPSGHQNPVSDIVRALETTRPLKPQHAAVMHWLNDVVPLPPGTTAMSQAGARTPIAEDGTMPYSLHGEPVHFQDAFERGGLEHLHIIAGDADDVVPPDVALAPLSVPAVAAYLREHPDAITHTTVRGGHIAPMTSAVARASEPGGVYAEHGAYTVYAAFAERERAVRERAAEAA